MALDNFFDEIDPSLLQFLILAILGVEAARIEAVKPAETEAAVEAELALKVSEAPKSEEAPETAEKAEALDTAEVEQEKEPEAVTYIHRSNNKKRLKPKAVYF
jgi:outer membrane biosynthesis protein TonB